MESKQGSVRTKLEQDENARLSLNATRSDNPKASRRSIKLEPDNFRLDFHRDYTRILHSRAFRRLRHKTQVFISPKNDHLCTRMEHSLHVASVAVTIARYLRLNEDLVQAIALGHDLGHAPFGHRGGEILDKIAKKHSLSFAHEIQSLRVVDLLDSPYPDYRGLNLTFAVRDGIACHNGEGFEKELAPDRHKKIEALTSMDQGDAKPATLEGCVVRWADKVAYLGRDLEDAIDLKLVTEDQLPSVVKRVLGINNREIIASLVSELTQNDSRSDCISVGSDVHEAMNALYKFNKKYIYKTDAATRQFTQIERAINLLFDFLMKRLEETKGDIEVLRRGREDCLGVLADFLNDDIRDWQKQSHPQLAIDFIAGMTDSYFISTCEELFLPKSSV
ncbi:MAG: dNTP triphosphohydrolase [Phycisphaerae bacterium]|nr:dNTP triphosphohydrolase [Phycisphaerae bacterium]